MLNKPYGDEDQTFSQINVIPLVDISLVLLIIFVVTANQMVTTTLKVEIPKVAHAQEAVLSGEVNITLSGEGVVYVDDQVVSLKEMRQVLEGQQKKKPDLSIVLNIDKAAYFQRVADTLDVLSDLGITKINIRTLKQ